MHLNSRAGTNFCIRANALQKVGWFPTRTITEVGVSGRGGRSCGACISRRRHCHCTFLYPHPPRVPSPPDHVPPCTQDYTLGMELKAAGLKGAYLAEYLAVGEAPSQLGSSLRALFRQRSRWCKGHWQVFCTPDMCPLIRWRLPFFQRWLYTVGTW